MVKIFVLLLLLFFIVRFFLRYILPVVRVLRTTQGHIQDLRHKMDGLQNEQKRQAPMDRPQPKRKTDQGDYIDYVEIK